MRSKFSIAGHPLHPALVAVPIGLFIWALVADIVYLARDRDMVWYDIALWTGIAAIVAALIAALPGFGDYFTMAMHSDARAIATTHMILNLSTVVLFIIAAVLMWDEGATDGGRLTAVVILHAVGVGVLALSGWLGGEMVFKHHLAVVPDDAEQERIEHARHETPATAHRT
jgi:uncharacterized membrane protein